LAVGLWFVILVACRYNRRHLRSARVQCTLDQYYALRNQGRRGADWIIGLDWLVGFTLGNGD
jgi:hypothetical protein